MRLVLRRVRTRRGRFERSIGRQKQKKNQSRMPANSEREDPGPRGDRTNQPKPRLMSITRSTSIIAAGAPIATQVSRWINDILGAMILKRGWG